MLYCGKVIPSTLGPFVDIGMTYIRHVQSEGKLCDTALCVVHVGVCLVNDVL